jgi:Icc-related predicted phosphoesterase
MIIKTTAISDLHGHLPTQKQIGEGDLLIIAGDICPVWNHAVGHQIEWLNNKFSRWLKSLDYNKKIVVAGNHDFAFQEKPQSVDTGEYCYLQESNTMYNGLKIWGSAWSNRFFDWAFNADEEQLKEIYSRIPDDTNIIVSHGPPLGFGDRTKDGKHVGSSSLRNRMFELKQLKYLLTAHIHPAYGKYLAGENIEIYNCSYVNEQYQPVNDIIKFNIEV